MATSIEGIYRDGHVELKERPADIRNETPVIVTFLSPGEIDLRAHGIDPNRAAELRAALGTFTDWNEPEMDVYDDYDASKANL